MKFRVKVKVLLRKHSISIPIYVAEINDDCLLGVFFLENVFESAFDLLDTERGKMSLSCSRIEVFSERVPSFLKELYVRSSKDLSQGQQEIFTLLKK